MVHGSIHPDIFCWPLLQAGPIWIQDRVLISIPATQTNHTPLPTQPSVYPRPTTYFSLPHSLSWLYSTICKAPQILLYPYAFPNHTLLLIPLNRLPPNVQSLNNDVFCTTSVCLNPARCFRMAAPGQAEYDQFYHLYHHLIKHSERSWQQTGPPLRADPWKRGQAKVKFVRLGHPPPLIWCGVAHLCNRAAPIQAKKAEFGGICKCCYVIGCGRVMAIPQLFFAVLASNLVIE